MFKRAGWASLALTGLLAAECALAQTLNNQSLTGKYYFRHVSLSTDAAGKLTDPRSLIGSITFDGAGRFTYTGQQVAGASAAAAASGSGAYSVDAAGFVVIDNPLRAPARINARLGHGALVGSTTETSDNTFDLFAAIPAPASGAALTGPYWTSTLEFPGGTTANVRNTFFALTAGAQGRWNDFTASGHAANLNTGKPSSQPVTGATYTMGTDGTGTATFGAASTGVLLSGSRTLFLSADGNLILGGSTAAGAHDFLIGVKAVSGATMSTWNANFWGAGLRFDSSGALGYAGAVSARGVGKLTWTKRLKALGSGNFDFTGINSYTLKSDGSGTVELTQVGLGSKAFAGSSVADNDPTAYEVYFGVQMPAIAGSAVFVHPQGVLNAANFAPAGNPIAPGEFIAIFGSGLAPGLQTATPPYPLTLGGVTVLINNRQAPLYFVSGGQINALVPYSTQGPTATIVVQNGTNSNTVTVPVAATAPGVFSLDQSGSGAGAIRHADFSVVNAANPARSGETVLVYLTGMGAVTPAVADGAAPASSPLSQTNAKPTVLVGGVEGIVGFSGLAPGFPGLYQINVQLPVFSVSGALPLAVQVGNVFHDQVDIQIR